MKRYFFTSMENIPPGMGFCLYGRAHIIWLLGTALAILGLCLALRGPWKARKKQLLISCCSISLALQIIGDLILIFSGQYALNYLPLDLCGLAIFAEFFCALRSGTLLDEMVYCLFMPGALMALLFPDWTMLPPLNFFSIRSFVIHGLLMAYPAMRLVAGDLKPDRRRLPRCAAVGLLMCIPIWFIDKALDLNFFFLNWPSPGSPLVLFAKWFGDPGYQIGIPIMVLAVWLILYLPFELKK